MEKDDSYVASIDATFVISVFLMTLCSLFDVYLVMSGAGPSSLREFFSGMDVVAS